MRSSKAFSKVLLASGMVAGALLGLGGCGPDYALYKVTISSTTTPRDLIEECRMTITDENNVVVLNHYLLPTRYGAPDSAGNQTLDQGCAGNLTKASIGTLSYSSSRTSGTLTFQVDALDNTGKAVQTGKKDANPAPYPPEVPVAVVIQ